MRQCDGRGQAKRFLNRTVSKRTGSLALFRHGTAKLPVNQAFVIFQNAAIQKMHCAGAAPPSPRGKALASSNVLCTAKRFLITINPCCCLANNGFAPTVPRKKRKSFPSCRSRVISRVFLSHQSLLPRRRWHTACVGGSHYTSG